MLDDVKVSWKVDALVESLVDVMVVSLVWTKVAVTADALASLMAAQMVA